MPPLTSTSAYKELLQHAEELKGVHLKELLEDHARNAPLFAEWNDICLDYCRQRVTPRTMELLTELANEMQVPEMIHALFSGEPINTTERRAALHTALRAPSTSQVFVGEKNVIPEVHAVLSRIKRFSHLVRSGEWTGHAGKALKDVVCIGIGGSYLGPEFVYEALKTDPEAAAAAQERRLRFLSNVDPVDVKRTLDGFHPDTTLVIIVSKTFTTAETMLNAKTVREWLLRFSKPDSAVSKHMAAVSTNIAATSEFGINPNNVFGFWDWVGGRYSVCSAVGLLPLAIHYGWNVVQQFLDGAHAMDVHFRESPLESNIPALMGLLSVWNSTFLNSPSHAVLPYSQSLLRFPAHIQQLSMESNGKGVDRDGNPVSYPTGEIEFGEPGTNGQHSFYQLMHQGRTVPADFIGFVSSQYPVTLTNEPLSNHDELMSNFFAQPDALALGKTADEVASEGCPEPLIPHRVFPGNRPSLSLLLPECSPTFLGALLSIYENKTAVQGFIWNINSFDQWGVEYGKQLAKGVGKYLHAKRRGHGFDDSRIPAPTRRLLTAYLSMDSAASGS